VIVFNRRLLTQSYPARGPDRHRINYVIGHIQKNLIQILHNFRPARGGMPQPPGRLPALQSPPFARENNVFKLQLFLKNPPFSSTLLANRQAME